MLSVDEAGGVLVLLVLVLFEVLLWLWGVVVLFGAVDLLVLVALVVDEAWAGVCLLLLVWSCVP